MIAAECSNKDRVRSRPQVHSAHVQCTWKLCGDVHSCELRMSVRIIVNADDLGISEAVNEATFRAMERGVITSATMLANGPEVVAAAKLAPRFPKCSFGVHLNL